MSIFEPFAMTRETSTLIGQRGPHDHSNWEEGGIIIHRFIRKTRTGEDAEQTNNICLLHSSLCYTFSVEKGNCCDQADSLWLQLSPFPLLPAGQNLFMILPQTKATTVKPLRFLRSYLILQPLQTQQREKQFPFPLSFPRLNF